MSDNEFKVGDLVKIKDGTPMDWGKNLYTVDYFSGDAVRIINKAGGIYWYAQSDLEPYLNDDVIEKTADKLVIAEAREIEELLMNNDKELRTKAELYDKICDKLFMATGIIEDGDFIQYIVEPELIINEIIKIITEIPESRKKQVERKRMFITKMRGSEW